MVGVVASSKKLAKDGTTGTVLVGTQGPYYDQHFLLGSKTTVDIGRDPDCAISLGSDVAISRIHAKVIIDSGRHYLLDVHSANGTFLNGERIEKGTPKVLTPGDQIRLGDTILVYE
jgi:pSer/pThr/pTyr-binding forkhead associated (FHA) protein